MEENKFSNILFAFGKIKTHYLKYLKIIGRKNFHLNPFWFYFGLDI